MKSPARRLLPALAASILSVIAASALPTLPAHAVDSTPPTYSEFTFTPSAINVTTGARTITVKVRLKDDTGALAPFSWVESSDGQHGVGYGEMKLVSGTTRDGYWQRAISVPRGAAPGRWKVLLDAIEDTSGNMNLGPMDDGYVAHPTPLTVANSGTVDTVGPVVSSFDFTPKSVDLGTGTRNVSVTMKASDTAGVDAPIAAIGIGLAADGDPVELCDMQLAAGTTDTNGSWSCTMQLPATAPVGNYDVSLLALDKLGNTPTQSNGAVVLTHATKLVVKRSGFTSLAGTRPAATNRVGEATGDAYADVWALSKTGQLDFFGYTPKTLTKKGIRGTGLTNISYMGAIPDQNGDKRADLFYRDKTDNSLWFAYNQGNGYLTRGIKVGQNWAGMDQIFYAGTMVAGSPQQYVLARRAHDGTLWRYNLNPSGLSNGTQVGRNWNGMRIMLSPGNMTGDTAWDVIAIRHDGLMFSYRSYSGGRLILDKQVGHGWTSMTTAFSPGDITGDGRLDLIGQRNDGTLWAYGNRTTGWSDLGQIGAGFTNYTLMA